jgi:uncharacterized membrane protein YbaN (DUF454 family)
MWHWRILGFGLLGLGGLGILLPVLPTTIFWILAALCFARSDPKIRDWIYARPGVGPQVKLFIEEGQMPNLGKRSALLGMTFAAGLLIILFYGQWLVIGCGLGLILIGAGVVLSRTSGALPPDKH